jgi:hypothetical protein
MMPAPVGSKDGDGSKDVVNLVLAALICFGWGVGEVVGHQIMKVECFHEGFRHRIRGGGVSIHHDNHLIAL